MEFSMEGFTLDANTVKDCAEPPAAVRTWENQTAVGLQGSVHHKDTEKAMIQDSECERFDSAYQGSECLSSTASLQFAHPGDVSDRLQELNINQCLLGQLPATECRIESSDSQTTRCEPQERLGARTQKRSAPEESDDDIFLTHDAYDQDEEGDTPLAQSIIYEKADIALKFIRYTPDPSFFNIRNCLGQTPLMLCVLTGQAELCRALVVAGASVDIQDQQGNTALHLACQSRSIPCVQALTDSIRPIEVKNTLSSKNHREPQNLTRQFQLKNYDGMTCIHLATQMNNVLLLRYLTSHGANVNEPDGKSGRTALHYAVEMNEFNLVQELISNLNANVDAVTFDLCTPLHLASGRGHVNVVYLLHGARADTQVQNFEGHLACDLTNNPELLELIMPNQEDFAVPSFAY